MRRGKGGFPVRWVGVGCEVTMLTLEGIGTAVAGHSVMFGGLTTQVLF